MIPKKAGRNKWESVFGSVDKDRGYFSDPDLGDNLVKVLDASKSYQPALFIKENMVAYSSRVLKQESSSVGLVLEDIKLKTKTLRICDMKSAKLLVLCERKENQEAGESESKIPQNQIDVDKIMKRAKDLYGSSISLCSEDSYSLAKPRNAWMTSIRRIKKQRRSSDENHKSSRNFDREKTSFAKKAFRKSYPSKIDENETLHNCKICPKVYVTHKENSNDVFIEDRAQSADEPSAYRERFNSEDAGQALTLRPM